MAVELPADTVRSALATLERRDARLAADAEAAVESLSWRESDDEPVVFGQHALQLFLWYELPRKWIAPEDELRAIARSLAELLDAAGAPDRYVALCRSAETKRMIESGGEGFVELLEDSGLEPPDTSLLEWSDLMTPEEATVREAASLYLEETIERGELDPGGPGWRDRQREVMEAFLTTPGEETGATPLARIRAARIDSWLGPPGLTDELGGERRSRLERVLPMLDEEPDAKAAALALAPLLWLLDLCEEGAPLTQTNALGQGIVRDGVECYPAWWHAELSGPPHREAEVRPLEWLHDLALALKLVRRHRRQLLLSRRGRELRAKPQELLRLVADELAAAGSFGSDIVLAVLLTEAQWAGKGLEVPVLVAVQVDPLLAPFAGLSGSIWENAGLTQGGRTLALAILRARATGPRQSLF